MLHRKKAMVEKRLRLYQGRNPDDEIIHWLDQFEGAGHGIESNAIKEALYRGITGNGNEVVDQSHGQPSVVVDLAEIRQVVTAAITEGLANFSGRLNGVKPESGTNDETQEDEETTMLLDSLGAALVLEVDDD